MPDADYRGYFDDGISVRNAIRDFVWDAWSDEQALQVFIGGCLDENVSRKNHRNLYSELCGQTSSVEDAIQQFKNGYDENFEPEYQDDERVISVTDES